MNHCNCRYCGRLYAIHLKNKKWCSESCKDAWSTVRHYHTWQRIWINPKPEIFDERQKIIARLVIYEFIRVTMRPKEVVCAVCQTKFYRGMHRRRFCSQACFAVHNAQVNAHQAETRAIRLSEHRWRALECCCCGCVFWASNQQSSRAKMCSARCSDRDYYYKHHESEKARRQKYKDQKKQTRNLLLAMSRVRGVQDILAIESVNAPKPTRFCRVCNSGLSSRRTTYCGEACSRRAQREWYLANREMRCQKARAYYWQTKTNPHRPMTSKTDIPKGRMRGRLARMDPRVFYQIFGVKKWSKRGLAKMKQET